MQISHSRKDGIIVPPRSKANIAKLADSIRAAIGWDTPFFPIIEFYEHIDSLVEGASFQVLPESEMGSDHGRTYPDRKLIFIREDIIEGAFDKKPRDRFTMSHELGHLFMHQGIALSRVNPDNPPKIFMNSEWQADIFASHLLMPRALLMQYTDISSIASDFGVSYEAAMARFSDFKKQ